MLSNITESSERNPAWNEEDEHRAKDTIYFLDTAKKHYASTVELDACIDWLKSLKDRVSCEANCITLKEWSEEDERICQCLIEDQEESLDKVSNDKYGHSEIISDLKEMYGERIDWLKTLKERIGWKPSEEQMEALTLAIHDVHEMRYKKRLLSLKQQLKQV